MLESNYSKSVLNSRRERREKLRALSTVPASCGNCAFFVGHYREGDCVHPKHASVKWSDGQRFLVPQSVRITQTCELFDGHAVTIRDPNQAIEAELDAIQVKYAPKSA